MQHHFAACVYLETTLTLEKELLVSESFGFTDERVECGEYSSYSYALAICMFLYEPRD